jgi:hypothetical protein
VSLAWSLWGELGASTWERRHQGWAIELEPLIAFTASLAEHDRRLLREAVDWCAANAAFVSLSQYRHVIAAPLWEDDRSFARLSATMTLAHRPQVAGQRGEPPVRGRLSGKSRLRELSVPSLLQLRLRAMFGVGTRAELVRLMLLNPFQEWSVAQLGERVAYTQRQAATDLEMLVKAGLVERTGGGPSRYVLRDAAASTRGGRESFRTSLRGGCRPSRCSPAWPGRWTQSLPVTSASRMWRWHGVYGSWSRPSSPQACRSRRVPRVVTSRAGPCEWALDVADALANADPKRAAGPGEGSSGRRSPSAVEPPVRSLSRVGIGATRVGHGRRLRCASGTDASPGRSHRGGRRAEACSSEAHSFAVHALAYVVSEKSLDRKIDTDAQLVLQLRAQLLQPHVVGVAHLDEQVEIRSLPILAAGHRAKDAWS